MNRYFTLPGIPAPTKKTTTTNKSIPKDPNKKSVPCGCNRAKALQMAKEQIQRRVINVSSKK